MKTRAFVTTLAIALTWSSACHKPVAPAPPLPSPTAAASQSKPIINSFDAEPTIVAKGQSSFLRWSVDNATTIEIDQGIGPVKPNDRRPISPQQTTTYSLKASNSAGTAEGSVTVTVSRPPQPASDTEQGEANINLVNTRLRDVHFNYNANNIRPDEQPILEADASLLNDLLHTDSATMVTIEGHCDERGSDEYNTALGDQRARAVKDALVRLGVPEQKLNIVSYGKERPLCNESSEECYARNRRVHFSAGHNLGQGDTVKPPR
jgi:peptidoglycan-associated lipoprotein